MRLPASHRFRFMVRDGAGQFTRSYDNVLAGVRDHRHPDPAAIATS